MKVDQAGAIAEAPAPIRVLSHPVFAAVYDRLNRALEREVLGPRRARLLGDLDGEVLELGAGTRASLSHFRRASRVIASELDPPMRRGMAAKLSTATVPVELADAAAQSLPFATTGSAVDGGGSSGHRSVLLVAHVEARDGD